MGVPVGRRRQPGGHERERDPDRHPPDADEPVALDAEHAERHAPDDLAPPLAHADDLGRGAFEPSEVGRGRERDLVGLDGQDGHGRRDGGGQGHLVRQDGPAGAGQRYERVEPTAAQGQGLVEREPPVGRDLEGDGAPARLDHADGGALGGRVGEAVGLRGRLGRCGRERGGRERGEGAEECETRHGVRVVGPGRGEPVARTVRAERNTNSRCGAVSVGGEDRGPAGAPTRGRAVPRAPGAPFRGVLAVGRWRARRAGTAALWAGTAALWVETPHRGVST